MRRFNLVHLDTLCCIARLGTFRAAADFLNTTQPAISGRVHDLEEAVGAPLFHKRGRRMELTPRGRELVQQVQPLLVHLDDILVGHSDPAAASGVVRIGAGEIAALSWFPQFMAQLKLRMPRVTCEVVIDLTMGMRQRLENGDIDVAILAGPVLGQQLRQAALGPVHLHWMSATPWPKNRPIEEMFAEVPIWSLARPSATYDMTLEALEAFGDYRVRAPGINTCTQIQALIEMVAAGAGIALLPDVMIARDIAAQRLRAAAPKLPASRLDFVIAWNAREEQTVIRNIVTLAQACSTFGTAPRRRRRSAAA